MTKRQLNHPKRQAEAEASEKLRRALIDAHYNKVEFAGMVSLVPDKITEDEKKVIEPLLQKWVKSVKDVNDGQLLHTLPAFEVREMIHNYFTLEKITINDKTLGDEYQQVMGLLVASSRQHDKTR